MSNENELTAKQLKGVEALATLGPKESMDAAAKRVGVTRKSLWKWWKTDTFREAVQDRISELSLAERGPVIRALVEQAKGGDVRAIRLFLQWRGEMIERREVDHKQPIRFIVGEQWLTGDEADAGELRVGIQAALPRAT